MGKQYSDHFAGQKYCLNRAERCYLVWMLSLSGVAINSGDMGSLFSAQRMVLNY